MTAADFMLARIATSEPLLEEALEHLGEFRELWNAIDEGGSERQRLLKESSDAVDRVSRRLQLALEVLEDVDWDEDDPGDEDDEDDELEEDEEEPPEAA